MTHHEATLARAVLGQTDISSRGVYSADEEFVSAVRMRAGTCVVATHRVCDRPRFRVLCDSLQSVTHTLTPSQSVYLLVIR